MEIKDVDTWGLWCSTDRGIVQSLVLLSLVYRFCFCGFRYQVLLITALIEKLLIGEMIWRERRPLGAPISVAYSVLSVTSSVYLWRAFTHQLCNSLRYHMADERPCTARLRDLGNTCCIEWDAPLIDISLACCRTCCCNRGLFIAPSLTTNYEASTRTRLLRMLLQMRHRSIYFCSCLKMSAAETEETNVRAVVCHHYPHHYASNRVMVYCWRVTEGNCRQQRRPSLGCWAFKVAFVCGKKQVLLFWSAQSYCKVSSRLSANNLDLEAVFDKEKTRYI